MSRSLMSRIALWVALSSLGAQAVALATPSLQATEPSPADGATGVAAALLLWVPGQTAVQHVVCLGSAPEALVEVARLPAAETYYYPGGGLAAGRSYYWRVDEVEASGRTITGSTWSFTLLGLIASSPQPQDDAPYQALDLTLTWTAGATAATHRVYLGVDRAAVAAAGVTWPEFVASLGADQANYSAKSLTEGTTYYWRVDEVELNGLVHRGPVWSFATIPVVEPGAADLVAWWTLDEGVGRVAVDWSGHQHHGTIHGGRWVQGCVGGALELDGVADFIEASDRGLPVGAEVFSITAWVRPASLLQDQTIISWGLELLNQGNRLELQGPFLCHRFVGNDCRVKVGDVTQDWIHVAVVHTGYGNRLLYLNGTAQETQHTGIGAEPNVAAGAVGIGASTEPVTNQFFGGRIDEVRVYNRILDPDELVSMIHADPLAAWSPRPGDRAVIDYAGAEVFTWSAGDGATGHDVYFGTDSAAVEGATPSTAAIYQGRVSPTLFRPAQTLVAGQTYFWRVDECLADGTVHAGSLWRLTLADYQVVDDFESYTERSPHRVFETWLDGMGYTDPRPGVVGNGTGSTVGHAASPYVEKAIIHGGRQSMPFYFDNGHSPWTSVIERRFSSAQDWADRGQTTLRIHLWADPSNRILESDQPYVELQDTFGRTATARGDITQAQLTQPAWAPWDIALSGFASAGVDLHSVRVLRIGIGRKSGPAGGQGVVYLDDIRLRSAGALLP